MEVANDWSSLQSLYDMEMGCLACCGGIGWWCCSDLDPCKGTCTLPYFTSLTVKGIPLDWRLDRFAFTDLKLDHGLLPLEWAGPAQPLPNNGRRWAHSRWMAWQEYMLTSWQGYGHWMIILAPKFTLLLPTYHYSYLPILLPTNGRK